MDSRAVVLILCAIAAGVAGADEAYRWVDADGVVHYSDRPEPGAESVRLPEDTTPPPALRQTRARQPDSTEGKDDKASGYESLAIGSPAPEETLWNIEGVLNVSLAVTPPLQADHQVRVYFDGKPQMVKGTSFQIQEVWRGVHNIQAEVLDANGKLLIRSQPTRFYVQQNSIIQRRP